MVWRDYILNNFGRKLVSLCLAVLIWYNIHSAITITNTNKVKLEENESPFGLFMPGSAAKSARVVTGEFADIPIKVLRSPGNKRDFRFDAEKVKVVVSGERETLNRLTANSIQAKVDLTDLPDMGKANLRTNVFARPVQVLTPGGISVVKVDPSAVVVELVSPPVTAVKSTENNE